MVTEERCDMMIMMVLVPTQFITSRTELYLWLMFLFSDLEVHQAYLWFVKTRPLIFLKKG